MGAKTSMNLNSKYNPDYSANYTMGTGSYNATNGFYQATTIGTVYGVASPLEPVDNDDEMPPLEPVDNDDEMPPLEPVDNDDEMPPIEPVDNDDEMPPLEPIYSDDEMPPLESVCEEPMPYPIVITKDTIVNTVIQSFVFRSNLGFKKYNKTLDRDDLSTLDWVNHTQEELMDAILYLERLKKNL
jgi:hypothetical protein